MSNQPWNPNNLPQKNTFPCDSGYSEIPQQQLHYSNQSNYNSNVTYYDPNYGNTYNYLHSSAYDPNIANAQNLMGYDPTLNLVDKSNISGFESFQTNNYPGTLYNTENHVSTSGIVQSQSYPYINSQMCNTVPANYPQNVLTNESISSKLQPVPNEMESLTIKDLNMNVFNQPKNDDHMLDQVAQPHINSTLVESSHRKPISDEEEMASLLHPKHDRPPSSASNQHHRYHQPQRNPTPCANLLPDNDFSLPINTLYIAPPKPLDSTNSALVQNIISEKGLKVTDLDTGPILSRDSDEVKNELNTFTSQLDSLNNQLLNEGFNKNLSLPIGQISLPHTEKIISSVTNTDLNKDDLEKLHTALAESQANVQFSNVRNSSAPSDYQPAGTNAALSMNIPHFNAENGPQYNMASGLETLNNSGIDNRGAFTPLGRRSSNRIVPNQEPLTSPEAPIKLITDSRKDSNLGFSEKMPTDEEKSNVDEKPQINVSLISPNDSSSRSNELLSSINFKSVEENKISPTENLTLIGDNLKGGDVVINRDSNNSSAVQNIQQNPYLVDENMLNTSSGQNSAEAVNPDIYQISNAYNNNITAQNLQNNSMLTEQVATQNLAQQMNESTANNLSNQIPLYPKSAILNSNMSVKDSDSEMVGEAMMPAINKSQYKTEMGNSQEGFKTEDSTFKKPQDPTSLFKQSDNSEKSDDNQSRSRTERTDRSIKSDKDNVDSEELDSLDKSGRYKDQSRRDKPRQDDPDNSKYQKSKQDDRDGRNDKRADDKSTKQRDDKYQQHKQKRKKYRLRLCVDTTDLRSWIVH